MPLPPLRAAGPGSFGSEHATVLLMSYYREDTRTLVRIAEELRRATHVRPLFLIVSTGALRDDAVAIVRAAGFDVFEELGFEDAAAGRGVRNPFRRARIVREANSELAVRILDRTGAAAILCTIDAARGHFVKAAQAMEVPSLYVQWTEIYGVEFHEAWWRAENRWTDLAHGPLMRLRRRLRRRIDDAAGLRHRWPFFIPATRLAVAGPFYRDMCIRAGVPAERIEVTGNTQCDAMHRCAGLTANEISDIKRSLGLSDSTGVLLYALDDTRRLIHLDHRSAAAAEETILAAMRAALPEFARVVKLHPKQGEEDRARIRAIDKEAVVIGQDVEIGALVAAASAVVSTVSSALLWAVGIDRPAISTYLWRGADEMRMARWWSGVEQADTFDALVKSLEDNFRDPAHIANWRAQRRECRERFLRVDGMSVSRIVKSLCSLLPERGGEAVSHAEASLEPVPAELLGAGPAGEA